MSKFDRRRFDEILVHEDRVLYMMDHPILQEDWQRYAKDYLKTQHEAKEGSSLCAWAGSRHRAMEMAVRLWMDQVLTPFEENAQERWGNISWFFLSEDLGRRISEVDEFFSEQGAITLARIYLEEKEKLQ